MFPGNCALYVIDYTIFGNINCLHNYNAWQEYNDSSIDVYINPNNVFVYLTTQKLSVRLK